jgi:hypothetical protein
VPSTRVNLPTTAASAVDGIIMKEPDTIMIMARKHMTVAKIASLFIVTP